MTVTAIPDLKFRLLWLIVGYLLVTLVFYLSLTSKPVPMSGLFNYEDKLYHALAYFTLVTWFSQLYHGKRHRLIIALAFAFMGLLIEFLQSLNPDRYPEFGDMMANTVGVIIGYTFTMRSVKYLLLRIEKALL